MHESSMKRMKWFAVNYLDHKKRLDILDVGSYNVNGCYREIFEELEFKYTGLDMEPGPNVDITPKKTYIWSEIKDDSFDAVVSGQALEHIEFFWITMSEIVRVTKKGGIICVIAPNGFKEHRYPVDCWRFFTDGMIALARFYNLEMLHAHTNAAPETNNDNWYSDDCADSMFIARKPYNGKAQQVNLDQYVCKPLNHEILMGEMKSYEEYQAVNSNKKTDESRSDIEHDGKPSLSTKATIKKIFKIYLSKIKQRVR